jgi:hypothetical protein
MIMWTFRPCAAWSSYPGDRFLETYGQFRRTWLLNPSGGFTSRSPVHCLHPFLVLRLFEALYIPDWCLRSKAAAPPRHSIRTVLLPIACHGVAGEKIPGVVPIAQRIPVPRRTNGDWRKAQFFPDRLCALHVFARRQGERWHGVFQGRVDQHGRVHRW